MLVPTRLIYLFLLTLISGLFGFTIANLWPVIFDQAFAMSWLTAITMWILAMALLIWTILARKKIKPEKGKIRLDPLLAARSAALAMAASRVGAIALGFYLGIFIDNFLFSDSPASNERAVISALTALASLVTIIVGLWLEHICKLPEPPTDVNAIGSVS